MPQDDLGLVRNDIVSVARTSGTGQPGSVDTYTITMRSGATFTFTITNGANGGTGGVQKLEFTTVSNFIDWVIANDLSRVISVAYFDADYNSVLCYLDNGGSGTKIYKMLPNGNMQELTALSSGEKIVAFYKIDESTQIDTALNENSVNPVQNKAIVAGIKATFNGRNTIPSNSDFNDYTENGSYWIYEGTGQLNKPNDISNGMLLVFTARDTVGLNNVLFQIIIDEKGIKYIRRKYSTSWTSWSKVISDDLFKTYDGVLNDFNNYLNPGAYWISNSAITNKPFNNNGCLVVFKSVVSGTTIVFQVAFNTSNEIFVRRYYGGTWNSWQTFKSGFRNLGVISGNFNDFIQEGSYFIPSGSYTNKPGKDQSWNGILLVFAGTTGSYTFVYQIAINQEGREWRRRYNVSGNAWTSWVDMKDIYNTGGSSIAYKKWYACGDSFTAQGYGENDPGYGTDSVLPSGKYAGQNAVYPFYIGNRTNCEVHNVAAGGMTISLQSGHNNSFTYNNQYQSLIGADADLITLYFGINDTNYNAPLGTIDDNDVSTFYGAWNTVVSWILQNRPNARLGIIISNGMRNVGATPASDYVQAEINIAKKWGVPYLNIDGDSQLPLVIRTVTRPDLSATRKQQFLEQFAVNYPSNTHPNYKAHENESYMIQQFLERL